MIRCIKSEIWWRTFCRTNWKSRRKGLSYKSHIESGMEIMDQSDHAARIISHICGIEFHYMCTQWVFPTKAGATAYFHPWSTTLGQYINTCAMADDALAPDFTRSSPGMILTMFNMKVMSQQFRSACNHLGIISSEWKDCQSHIFFLGMYVVPLLFYIRAAGRRARNARRPAVQNVFVIAQGHGGGHASPIEAAGQWFY